ncbi:alpha-1,3/1,6-mannosyltransferase ALG2 isoform X2 [Lagopus muta]|uniref:alpha-1,3/1,6-mannosyltransferase ALG2 isoform X2 n=1 Tax=Lagopus muta TaxID=64668 RepID=UPI00209C7180|nr:alpha-1,3/1,6-mannosyltransferase ALG2 isoform X2 [Lagopus muta]
MLRCQLQEGVGRAARQRASGPAGEAEERPAGWADVALEPAGGACALPLGAMAEQGEGEEASGPSVLFLHPDLGLGGAERLVVDAALALKARGCQVQVSACIPILRLARTRKKVLFYCHFPDQLLTKRESFLKRLYRMPLDWLEEYTTGMADCIVVNSKFTASVFKETFKSLSHINPDVLYPSLNTSSFETVVPVDIVDLIPKKSKFLFLSINRYERKKNLALALEALHELRGRLDSHQWSEVHLVMAGGYDKRVLENVEHYEELRKIATELNVSDHVTFVRSFTDEQKISLLSNCVCVLYTPSNEHFGIVPLEAMYMRRPVIAVNSGGPLESILNNVTGFLCDPLPTQFSEAMEKIVRDPLLKDSMGAAGRVRFMEKFSSEAFSEQLYQYICRLTQ